MEFCINKLKNIPQKFSKIEKPPKELYFIGNELLLNKKIVSIVGTRRPNNYTKIYTAKLAKALKDVGVVCASGGAMGVDAIVHQNSFPNTIAVAANSLDIIYPAVNEKLFTSIYKDALAISEYEKDFKARPYTFVHRNRLVVGLGECLVVTEADEGSGSLRSVEFALSEGKKVYVLPHRLGDSKGTQKLVKDGLAEPIYDISTFVSQFGNIIKINNDYILEFCKDAPYLSDALEKFGEKIYEYELDGKIEIKNLKVFVV